ncbi:MAG: GTPase domain-containing protein [Acidobacteriota bacterium]
MVLFNHATREMTAKIVYYGPGLGGKTTNLLVIYDRLDADKKGKMLSLATRSDRTLFFDLLPVEGGKVGNFDLKIQIYTVPGQVFYNETRKLVLRGADSIVFVADSQPSMVQSNRESFDNLVENLRENQLDPADIPIVVQYNKRDIPGVLPVEELKKRLGFEAYPSIGASALRGDGVMETFELISKITARKLLARMQGRKAEAGELQAEAIAGGAAPDHSPDHTETDLMPIAGTDDTPFENDYEKMEEVSLEQLLEGRDRPAALQADKSEQPAVDQLSEHDLIPDEVPALDNGPDSQSGERIDQLEEELQTLKTDLSSMRDGNQEAFGKLAQGLADLTELIKKKLG